jgi:hypothetical protein
VDNGVQKNRGENPSPLHPDPSEVDSEDVADHVPKPDIPFTRYRQPKSYFMERWFVQRKRKITMTELINCYASVKFYGTNIEMVT